MKHSFYLILLTGAALAVSSCNTFIGMGRDIEMLGSGMQTKAKGKGSDGSQVESVQSAPAPASSSSH